MGLLERVQAAMAPKERAWPVGQGAVPLGDRFHGHQSEFSPESYGDYLATSTEIYSVATLRARLISGLQLNLYQGTGSGRSAVTSGPAVDLLRYVNPFWTPVRLARMDELSMCLWGETFWAIERDRSGVPSEIWWLKPSRVRPVPSETGYLAEFLYEPVTGGAPIRFAPDEIVWFRYPNPIDEFAPISPLGAARLAADTGSAMMTANRNLFTNGLMAGGLIVPQTDKVVFSPEQAAELEHLLDRRWKGVDKAHRWSVLRFEAQLKELGVTPKDAEFLGGLNLTLRQVCNAYGVPSPLLNDMEHATLANVRELLKAVWSLTLVPDSQLKAAEIGEQFLPLFKAVGRADVAEYDYSKVPELQEAASEVWARERQAIEIGRLTVNEIREANGEPPVPWGDVWFAPVNKAPVSGPDGAVATEGQPDGGEAAPAEDAAVKDLAARVTAAGVLIRSAFDPADSLRAVGLDPIKHLGLLPVTVLPESDAATADAAPPAESPMQSPMADEGPDGADEADPEDDDQDAARALLLSAFNGHGRA